MARKVTVREGDTLSAIAQKFSVPVNAISGFKSGDPNQIFPGETLLIDDSPKTDATTPITIAPTVSDKTQTSTPAVAPGVREEQASVREPAPEVGLDTQGGALVPPNRPPVEAPTIESPPTEEIAPDISGEEPALQGPDEDPLASFLDVEGEPDEDIFTTPSGAEVTAEGQLISGPEKQQADQTFGQFGLSTEEIQQGFLSNPFATIGDLVTQVMSVFQLPDVAKNIDDITGQIEELENERDTEIEKIRDNPFFSAGSKSQRIQKIEDRFELRIANRTNRLKLLENSRSEARQQAQFAASLSVNLFGKGLDFKQDQLESILDQREKTLEATRKLGPLVTEQVDGFTVLRDQEGNVVSTVKPPSPTVSGGDLLGAITQFPFLFNELTPSEKAKVIPGLNSIGFEFPRDLSATEREAQNAANLALISLSKLEDQAFNEAGELDKGVLGRAITGLGTFAFQRRELLDLIARMRTGAALTTDEEAFYKRQVPRFRDDEDTVREKINHWRALFSGLAGASIILEMPDGSFAEARDMYDQATRADVRNAINNGAIIAEVR